VTREFCGYDEILQSAEEALPTIPASGHELQVPLPHRSRPESTEEQIHGGFLHLASQDLQRRLETAAPSLYDCLLAAIYFRKTGDQAQALQILDVHKESPVFDATYNRIQSLCHNLNFTSAQASAEHAFKEWAKGWTQEQQQYTRDICHITATLRDQGRFPTELKLALLERNRYRNLDSGEHTPCTGVIDRNQRFGRLASAIFDPASATWIDSETGLAISELLQPNHDFRAFFGGSKPWLTPASGDTDSSEDHLTTIAIFIESNPHFGHFLTQSASFANALGYAQHFTGSSEDTITILSRGDVPAWARMLLQASCPNPLQFRTLNGQRRLKVDKLVVAPPTWIEWHYDHQRLFRQAALRWRGPDASTEAHGRKRLYFSRSRLKQCLRRSVNEHELEERLRTCGFEIVHPQEHPLHEVAELVNQATLISGAMGSAMHNVLFRLPGQPLATVNFAHFLPGINNAMAEQCSAIDHNFYSRSCEELDAAPGKPKSLHFDLRRCLDSVEQVIDHVNKLV
jgi:hypothetical protein